MMAFMDSVYRLTRARRMHSPLRSGFEAAIKKLAAEKSGLNPQRLPWYLLLGLPHSGKTSLLQGTTANQWRKIANLREHDSQLDCDWWNSGNAVVMDMSGRYALNHETGGASRWQQFTRTLQACLQPKAIKGVILVVSAEDLLDPDDECVMRTARMLQQCLRELQSCYNYQIPCYLLISKCDHLTGFNAFFSTLTQEDRRQPWGTTLNGASIDELSLPLSALQDAVQAMLPLQLQAARDAAIRRSMVIFPAQFSRLQTSAMHLASTTFSPDGAMQSPLLRGIYFAGTSAGMGENQRRWFSERLFNDVVLADPIPAQLTADHNVPYSRLRSLSFAATISAMVLVLAWSVLAFIAQHRDITATQDLLRQNAIISAYAGSSEARRLAGADDAITLLERALKLSRRHSSGWAALPGMHDASVANTVQSMHLKALEQRWLPALAAHLLRGMPTSNSPAEDQFNALKAWLMLTDPAHRDIDFLQRWIGASSPFDKARRTVINTRLRQLHDAQVNFAAPVSDNKTIEQIRSRLAATPLAERIYDQWKQRYRGKYLALKPLLGPHADSVFSIGDETLLNIPTLYTAETHQQLHLEEKLNDFEFLERDQWVLGDLAPDPSQRPLVVQALNQRYLADYAQAWNNVFNTLSLRRPASSAALISLLQPLSDSTTSPLSALLRVSAEQTRPLARTGLAFDPGKDRITALENRLMELRDWLSTIYYTDRDALMTQTTSVGDVTASQKLVVLSQQFSPPVASWVASLARAASASVDDRTRAAIDVAWRTQVAAYCRAGIGDRYPFAPQASRAVSYRDFVEYFRPGGIEDSFVRTHLGNEIDRTSWTSKAGAVPRLPAHTLRLLRQAHKIRNAFFNGSNVGFAFSVTPQRMSANLQQFTIDAGSTHFRYSHGPRLTTPLRWPQDGDTLRARFTSLGGSSVTRNYEGVWGLYHLLDAAQQARSSDSRAVSLTLQEGEQSIVLTLAPLPGSFAGTGAAAPAHVPENPLRRELLSDYRCVESLR